MRCAGCNQPIATGASRLFVHDATGGPTGTFCCGQGQACYLAALDRHMAAEATQAPESRVVAGKSPQNARGVAETQTAAGGPLEA